MKTTDAAMGTGVRTIVIVAALAIPVIAGAISLGLVHDGPPSCDPNAIRLRAGMCVVPTNPSDAPSSIVRVPASVDHHTAERLWIIAAGVLLSAILFAFVARSRSDPTA